LTDYPADKQTREFVRLLATHERRLNYYVLALVPHWADAEDVIQQTKLRLWEQFPSYDPTKDFGAWACTIAHYEILSLRTRAGRARVEFSQQFIERVAEAIPRAIEERDGRLNKLRACLQKLTDWQRDLLQRCCVADDSVTQVARELNRKVDSTRKALLRIRHRLYRCMEGLHKGERS